MIVTLEDIYRLPQLDGAAVSSGQNMLWRKITSVRVLRVVDYIEHEIGFDKNELAITSFDEVWEEPHLQKLFIEEIVRSGVVGLVLFSSVPGRNEVKPDVVAISESLCLPVFCLPGKNNPMLCGEIVGAVHRLLRDAENENTLTIAMLDYMTKSSQGGQSIQAAAKLLASWMNASVLLADMARNIIAYSAYGGVDPVEVFQRVKIPPASQNQEPLFIDGLYLYHAELQQINGAAYQFYVLRSVKMERQELITLVNAIQFAIRLWGEQAYSTTGELVKAMLQDEPLKKCQLASLFHVNVEDMDSIWLVHSVKADKQEQYEKLDRIRNLTAMSRTLSLTDVYEKSIVIFLAKPETLEEGRQLQQEILNVVDEDDILFCVENLPNTAEVRNVYRVYLENAEDCRKIYPHHRIMSDAHLNVANRCRQLMIISPNYSDIMISPVYRAKGKVNPQDMVDFLSAYLLDADMDLNVLAEMLYLHRNTIKYRLNALSNVFGFEIGSFPDTFYLMLVLAVRRLQQQTPG